MFLRKFACLKKVNTFGFLSPG